MKKLRFGIIGTGSMGAAHMGFFCKGLITRGELTTVADINPDRLTEAAGLYPGSYSRYKSGEELIDKAEVDAVIIAAPHYLHPGLAVRAFEKGLHVLTEKPAGVYEKQVLEMNAAAVKSGKRFGIMFNQRLNPLFQKMRALVLSGAIGVIKRADYFVTNWFRTQSYYDSCPWRATWRGEGGGVLINQAVHQLDLLDYVTGLEPASVRAFCSFGGSHDIETEDDVTAYIEYSGGARGVFTASTSTGAGVNRFEIIGTKGRLTACGGKLEAFTSPDADCDFIKACPEPYAAPVYKKEEFTFGLEFGGHAEIINNFTDACLDGNGLKAEGAEGIKSVGLINAMLQSGWRGGSEVKLPLDADEYYLQLRKRIKKSKAKPGNAGGRYFYNTGAYGKL